MNMEKNKMSNQELTNHLSELEMIFENVKSDVIKLNNLLTQIEIDYLETQELLEKRLGLNSR
jgi:hypothetical protein